MGQSLEEGWQNSLLSGISDQSSIGMFISLNGKKTSSLKSVASDPDSRELSEKVWTVLKTFLFSTLMVQQSVLDGILYVPPPRSLNNRSSKTSSAAQQSPSDLCCSILVTLSSISFVIATFGGVTAGASPNADGEGRSFPELKKVFYMAVDILSANASASEEFVEHLIAGINANYGRHISNLLVDNVGHSLPSSLFCRSWAFIREPFYKREAGIHSCVCGTVRPYTQRPLHRSIRSTSLRTVSNTLILVSAWSLSESAFIKASVRSEPSRDLRIRAFRDALDFCSTCRQAWCITGEREGR